MRDISETLKSLGNLGRAIEVATELDDTTAPPEEEVRSRRSKLFEDIARRLVDVIAATDPDEAFRLESRIKRFLLPALEGRPLSAIRKDIAMRIRNDVFEAHSRGVARQVVSDLIKIVQHAEWDRLVPAGTAARLKLNRIPDRIDISRDRAVVTAERAFTDDDLDALWNGAETISEKFMIVLGLELGLRPGEIAAANRAELVLIDDEDGRRGYFNVRYSIKDGIRNELPDDENRDCNPVPDASRTKTHKRRKSRSNRGGTKNQNAKRMVVFGADHHDLFKSLLPQMEDPNGYFVAPTQRTKTAFCSVTTLGRMWKNLCKRAGVTRTEMGGDNDTVLVVKAMPKMLRKSFAAVQLREGVLEDHVRDNLGHGAFTTTVQSYAYDIDRLAIAPPIAPLRVTAAQGRTAHTRSAHKGAFEDRSMPRASKRTV